MKSGFEMKPLSLSATFNHVINQNVELNVAPLSNMSLLSGTGEKVSNETLYL